MKIIEIIISKQKYLLIMFIMTFFLINTFVGDALVYIEETLQDISINSNQMLSANFYMNDTEELYISTDDVEHLQEVNDGLIISEVFSEETQGGTIYYLSPKLKDEFIKYNMINDANADYYTGSGQNIDYSYRLGAPLTQQATCKGKIQVTSNYTVDCSTDYLVFANEESYNQMVEAYYKENSLTDKIFSFGSYYSDKPIVSDKYNFSNLSDAMQTTSLAHIKSYIQFIKYFGILLVLLILFIAFLFAFSIFLSFKTEIKKLSIIGISRIIILLNYLVIFSIIGLLFYILDSNIYLYISFASLILMIITALTWGIND
ncbi:hypothetical protein RZE82_08695 [Mollicutes bacterium LVI A0039]|nr:hypothetical protein RZE82_08695 [Mollicutes bacterium LVI A0039]